MFRKIPFNSLVIIFIILLSTISIFSSSNASSQETFSSNRKVDSIAGIQSPSMVSSDEDQGLTDNVYYRPNEYFINIKKYGAFGDGVHDDAATFQKAINDCARDHLTLYIPRGTYLIKSQLTISDNFNIEGESKELSILKVAGVEGAAINIVSNSRMNIYNLSIQSAGQDEALDYGIKIQRKGENIYPGFMEFQNVEIKGLQKENAVAFYMDDCSLVSFDSCTFTTNNGTAFEIEGNNYNTGVYDFKNTTFGSPTTDKYGMDIDKGPCIDAITFEDCYFGGKIAAEKLGDAYDTLRTTTHYACRFENATSGDTSLVELWGGGNKGGGYGLSWYNCTFSGSENVKSAFKFTHNYRSKAGFRSVTIFDCIFDKISDNGYIIDNQPDTYFTSCELGIGNIIGTNPSLFSYPNFKDEIDWVGGWNVKNKYSEFDAGIALNKARITFSDGIPSSGYYSKGDIVLNSAKPTIHVQSGKKYMIKGWKRKTSNNSHVLNVDWLEMRAPVGDTKVDIEEPNFSVKINFQPKNADIPEGYKPDYGEQYGNRGNGFTYGWNTDYSTLTRDRNINKDQKLDTICQFGSKVGKWEIAVPNGKYTVNVSVGDAGFASAYTLNVEGVNYLTNLSLEANKFQQIIKTITVTDGKITVDQGDAANLATRINYIEINGQP